MSQPVFGLQLGFHLNTISIPLEIPTHHISGCYSSHWGLALVHIQQIFHLEMPQRDLSQTCSPLSFYHSQINYAASQDILLPQAPQLWGFPSSLPCCFLSCHKPAASPCALFSGEIPGEDGLLFWSVLLISCTQLLSSLYTSPTVLQAPWGSGRCCFT